MACKSGRRFRPYIPLKQQLEHISRQYRHPAVIFSSSGYFAQLSCISTNLITLM
jgi:hypothetical protein